jgi:dTDP-4-amino-4,6-dideoxygalactose transaminase
MLMISLSMHGNGIHVSFTKFTEFSKALSEYTGAPYVVLTDCCTHAIELCLRLQKKPYRTCTIPYRTYLSVPMTFHKLGIPYTLDTSAEWQGEYRIAPTNIWDSARRFERGMYRKHSYQCLSFGYSKTLEIGHGGAILLDDKEDHEWLKRASYDGRDLSISPWQDQVNFQVGYHYRPTIEDCVTGINMLAAGQLKDPQSQKVTYPDLTKIKITN